MEDTNSLALQEGENQEVQELTHEELLQQFEQSKARLNQFDNMGRNLVTEKLIYLKMELEESHDIQKALRDLISFYNANMSNHTPSTLFNAMRLLEYLTLSHFEAKNPS